jgi:hypothetical protein
VVGDTGEVGAGLMDEQVAAKFRPAGLKALSICLLSQLGAGCLALQFQDRSLDSLVRSKALVGIVFLLVVSIVFGLISYVRFLDWKRSRVMVLKRSS